MLDFKDLMYTLEVTPVLGIKGTTGNQTSFLEWFDGDYSKAKLLETVFCDKLSVKSVAVSSQTATCKL
jgi:adenylosuccinate lyase